MALRDVREMEDHTACDAQVNVVNHLPILIAQMRETHRAREDMQRAEMRLTLQIKAIQRRIAAAEKVLSIHKGAEGQPASVTQNSPALNAVLGDDLRKTFTDASIRHLEVAREPLHAAKLVQEKQLAKLAQQLPVWPWVDAVRGFGAVGLGQIVGEAGDLSRYANPAKLWKRMGLAVMPDGRRQRRVTDVDEAAIQGYSPRRRSIMFVIGDSLIKGNGDGAYRTTYLERKEYERLLHPDLSDMATHRRAQRYMEKQLLKHLWQAWRELTPSAV